jgi:hypothetical protein
VHGKLFLEKQAEMPMSLNENRAGKQGNLFNAKAQYCALHQKAKTSPNYQLPRPINIKKTP